MVGEEGERAEFSLNYCFQVRITLRVRFLKRIADKNCDPLPSITSVCLYIAGTVWPQQSPTTSMRGLVQSNRPKESGGKNVF